MAKKKKDTQVTSLTDYVSVENNMYTIFGIDFLASEFELNGLRVDSLGYDKKESNSFNLNIDEFFKKCIDASEKMKK